MSWESTLGSMCESRLSQPSMTECQEALWDALDGWDGLGAVYLGSSPASRFVLGANSSTFLKLSHFLGCYQWPLVLSLEKSHPSGAADRIFWGDHDPLGRKEVGIWSMRNINFLEQ